MWTILAMLAACGNKAAPPEAAIPTPEPAPAVAETSGERLSRYLRGSFDSAQQAEEDESYYAISLEMCTVAVPEIGEDVLYVEQAVMDKRDQPYRQRLYVIETIDETQARSRIFELADPDAWIGACAKAPATGLAAGATEKEGCAVVMVWDGARLAGGTSGKDCQTALRGAAYATSEITITDGLLTSWDRGFADDDTQAWGATEGPYRFVRRTPLE